MSDVMAPPVINREKDKILQIYNKVASINNLLSIDIKGRGKPNIIKTKNGNIGEVLKKENEKQNIEVKKQTKDRQGFFKGLTSSFVEKTKELAGGIKNIGKGLGESAFSMLLGPLQLITKPFEELGNFKFFSVLTGFFKNKKVSSKPTRSKMLKIDPGAVYIADALKPEKKNKKLFGNLFGKGGLFSFLKNINPLKLLSMLGFVGIFAGLTLSDIFGEGGAIEFFKKGEVGKAILTALFGKDNSQKGGAGKLLGLGKQALKWGALGAAIGTIVPGLGTIVGGLVGIGLGLAGGLVKLGIDTGFFTKVWAGINKEGTTLNKIAKILTKAAMFGALGAIVGTVVPGLGTMIGAFFGMGLGLAVGGIQLGFDTGFFANIWNKINEKGTVLNKIAKILTKAAMFGALGAIVGSIVPGLGTIVGAVFGLGLGLAVGGIQLGIDTGFFNKIWKGIKGGMGKIGKWFMDAIFIPIADLFNKIVNWVSTAIIAPIVNLFSSVFSKIGDFVTNSIVAPLKNFWSTFTTGAKKAWEGSIQFIKDMGNLINTTIIAPIKGIFNKIKKKVTDFTKNSFSFVSDLFKNIKNAIFGFFDKIFGFIRFIGSNSIFKLIGMTAKGQFGSQLAKFNKARTFEREALSGDKETYSQVNRLAKEMRRYNPSLSITESFTKALNKLVSGISDKVKPVTIAQVVGSDAFNHRNIDGTLSKR